MIEICQTETYADWFDLRGLEKFVENRLNDRGGNTALCRRLHEMSRQDLMDHIISIVADREGEFIWFLRSWSASVSIYFIAYKIAYKLILYAIAYIIT